METTRHTLQELVHIIQTNGGRRKAVYRPALPVAPVYPMDQLKTRIEMAGDTSRAQKPSRRSMFFRISGNGMENDPFLQRLSRLQ